MSDDKIYTYAGANTDVKWDGALCIHVGECGRASGELFQAGRQPWCQPNVTDVDDVAEVVERCPTGALTYQRTDGVEEQAASENTVVVANHGPLYVKGDLDIAGASAPGVAFRAALCRCGQSKNKPFCDNSHEKSGFSDRGAIGMSGKGFDDPGGKLSINAAPNGPLLLKGNVTLKTAAGRSAFEGTKCALCRCGASKNKPFCDGSHREAGFKAP